LQLGDFKTFVAAAHERRIKVLIELVVNPRISISGSSAPGTRRPSPDARSRLERRRSEFRKPASSAYRKSNWTFDPVASHSTGTGSSRISRTSITTILPSWTR
jgi:hypothetical protein